MSVALDIAGWVFLALGGFFCLVGGIGVNRMPDVFTRMHAGSVSDTLGVGFLALGMATQTTDWLVLVRLGIIVVVLYVTSTVATHALARAALHDGNKPLLAQPDGTLEATDCGEIFPELGARMATPLVSEAPEGEAPALDPAGTGPRGEDAPSNS